MAQQARKHAYFGDKPRASSHRLFTPLEPLRGIAAMLVVIYHTGWTNPLTNIRFFENAPLMVDLFFVLSGFVICYSYGTRLKGSTEYRQFFWLRFWRLYPLHFASFLIFLVIGIAAFHSHQRSGILTSAYDFCHHNAVAIGANLFLLHSTGITHSFSFNYPSWSISAEALTYALYAMTVRLCGNGVWFVAASIPIILLSDFLLLDHAAPSLTEFTYSFGVCRCSAGFFIGALTWHLHRWTKYRSWPFGDGSSIPGWLAIIGSLTFLALADPKGIESFIFPFLAAAVVLCLARSSGNRVARQLTCPFLLWLGKISYSIYMVHALVNWCISNGLILTFHWHTTEVSGDFLLKAPTLVGTLALIVYLVVVLGVAQISYTFLEEPFRRLARRSDGTGFLGKRKFHSGPARCNEHGV